MPLLKDIAGSCQGTLIHTKMLHLYRFPFLVPFNKEADVNLSLMDSTYTIFSTEHTGALLFYKFGESDAPAAIGVVDYDP